ncbi:hypothetical protein LENED_003365 [Lentinula edodes]|uniref:Uncharacterized protein n=1 Tax=Lentinula edodes TaxID=5353 RepID=A0A1Q3E3T1_LENED|nr:hypothetical protein LENED_003365 [Lentinula edodes]
MQDWEQQDQDLKEREIALKERELSLYQREVSLWESEADLARRERQDADALYERWKRARDYHITAIESEKRMRAEIKDEQKRLEEYEKEVVRREKNAKKLEEFNDLNSLEAHHKLASLQQQLDKAEKANADLLAFCETVGRMLSTVPAREPGQMLRAAEKLVE